MKKRNKVVAMLLSFLMVTGLTFSVSSWTGEATEKTSGGKAPAESVAEGPGSSNDSALKLNQSSTPPGM